MANTKQKAGKGGAPVSSHPAFPAIVALWFAALFGIGSLVLPHTLLEGIITGIGIDAVVPAAAPPLGFTARAMTAVLAAGIGLATGLVLARKVTQSQSPAIERSRDLRLNEADRHPDAPAKRPISASSELGSEGLGPLEDPWKFEDEWAESDEASAKTEADQSPDPVAAKLAGRRRSLSVTDDSGPSEFMHTVPLPGQSFDEPLELDLTAEQFGEKEDAALEEFAEETDALRNVAQLQNDGAAKQPAAVPGFYPDTHIPDTMMKGAPTVSDRAAPALQEGEDSSDNQDNDFATSFMQEESMTQPTQPAMPSFAAPNDAAATNASEPPSDQGENTQNGNALSDLGMAELVERFATALQAKAEREREEKVSSAPVPATAGFDGANPFADRADDADLQSFSATSSLPFTSPLVSESGLSAPAESEAVAERKAEEPMVFRRANATAAMDASDAAETPFGSDEPAMPSALRPLDMSDSDEVNDDLASAPLSIDFARQHPFAGPVAPTNDQAEESPPHDASFAAPEVALDISFGTADQDDSEGQDAYSSLLNMKSMLSGHEFVRVEDKTENEDTLPEPVVVFPGQQDEQPADNHKPNPRPFDAPTGARSAGNAGPSPAASASEPSDPSETERALREALEKLQRMSGAA